MPTVVDKTRVWSMKEIQDSVSKGAILIICLNKVYNVTKWADYHPGGGMTIRHMAGKDATDVMIAFHPKYVFGSKLARFCVGSFNSPHNQISSSYRMLEQKFQDEGLFETDYWYYYREYAKFIGLWLGMVTFIVWNQSNWSIVASCLCATSLWHQAAFVVHDAGHSEITHDAEKDFLLGVGLADLFGGLSVGWWKFSHNVHHVVTNDPEHDPDIQHMPFMAISSRFTQSLYSTYHKRTLTFDAIARIFVPIQHLTFYLVLAFGRFNLYVQSWTFVLSKNCKSKRNEIIAMSLFWVWFITLMSFLPSYKHIAAYVLASNMLTVLLHLQICLSHFGMSTIDPSTPEYEETYAEKALRTTMDINCPRWLDWLHGGLQFQIEHHLFPRMPRHNLRKIRKRVEEFASDHDLQFHSYGFLDGNVHVVGVLRTVAQQIKGIVAADVKNIHVQ